MIILPKLLSLSQKSKGLTLIELLVVVTLLGILAVIGLANYQTSIAHGRDAKRKSDITQYRNLLQEYAISHSTAYPTGLGWDTGTGLTITSSSTTFCTALNLSPCITDPLSGKNPHGSGIALDYHYLGNGTSYALFARLELNATSYWVACSSGRSGIAPSVPSSPTDCPVP